LGESYCFIGSIVGIGGGKLGIYIPKDVQSRLEHLRGRKVVVIVYVPENPPR